jgi:hypothetical protein
VITPVSADAAATAGEARKMCASGLTGVITDPAELDPSREVA